VAKARCRLLQSRRSRSGLHGDDRRGNVCGNRAGTSDENTCRLYAKDKDCEALGFPLVSACVVLDGANGGGNCAATDTRARVPSGT
jgi:hypothetical protein